MKKRGYSAKDAAKGKDLGKPNTSKNAGFANLSRKAANEYGSKAAGMRVAGAVLNKLRHKGK